LRMADVPFETSAIRNPPSDISLRMDPICHCSRTS
jgi:hypothetical protein